MNNFCINIEFQVCARLWAGFCSNIWGMSTSDVGMSDRARKTLDISTPPARPLVAELMAGHLDVH